jgi:hypothetical protein
MSHEIWVSGVMGDFDLGDKLGIRAKYHGEDWEPPTHIIPLESDRVYAALGRHKRGEKLPREEFPDACYVFDEPRWKRSKDLFFGGSFYAVKGKLAELLKGFDLGQGELIEFPIYKADKATRLPGPFYFLNFGAQRDTFVPSESSGITSLLTVERSGRELWECSGHKQDVSIAVSAEAFVGPDLWFEKKLHWVMFMSGRLHDAIVKANINVDFRFSRAKILT